MIIPPAEMERPRGTKASKWSSFCWLQCVAADSAASTALCEGVFLKPVLHRETPSPTSHTLTYLGLIPLNQVSYLETHKSPLNTSRPKFHCRHWTATSRGAASLLASFHKAAPCCASCCGEKTRVALPDSCLCSDPAQDHCYQAGHVVMTAPPTGLCQDRRPGLWTGQSRWPFPGQVPGATIYICIVKRPAQDNNWVSIQNCRTTGRLSTNLGEELKIPRSKLTLL